MANGKAGAAKGNRNAAKGHLMRNALIKAIKIRSGIPVAESNETFQALVDMADAQINNAMTGDHQAFIAIADRLDGKPGQSIALSADANVTFNLDYVADSK